MKRLLTLCLLLTWATHAQTSRSFDYKTFNRQHGEDTLTIVYYRAGARLSWFLGWPSNTTESKWYNFVENSVGGILLTVRDLVGSQIQATERYKWVGDWPEVADQTFSTEDFPNLSSGVHLTYLNTNGVISSWLYNIDGFSGNFSGAIFIDSHTFLAAEGANVWLHPAVGGSNDYYYEFTLRTQTDTLATQSGRKRNFSFIKSSNFEELLDIVVSVPGTSLITSTTLNILLE